MMRDLDWISALVAAALCAGLAVLGTTGTGHQVALALCGWI